MVAACSLKLWFGATRVQAMVPSINCKDYGRMVAFMTQSDHADIRQVSVFELHDAAEHDRQGWIFAATQMIVGSKGGIQNCAATFIDNHPLFRHNLFFGLQVDS